MILWEEYVKNRSSPHVPKHTVPVESIANCFEAKYQNLCDWFSLFYRLDSSCCYLSLEGYLLAPEDKCSQAGGDRPEVQLSAILEAIVVCCLSQPMIQWLIDIYISGFLTYVHVFLRSTVVCYAKMTKRSDLKPGSVFTGMKLSYYNTTATHLVHF